MCHIISSSLKLSSFFLSNFLILEFEKNEIPQKGKYENIWGLQEKVGQKGFYRELKPFGKML